MSFYKEPKLVLATIIKHTYFIRITTDIKRIQQNIIEENNFGHTKRLSIEVE